MLVSGSVDGRARRVWAHLGRRKWPTAVTGLVLVTGMAYSLFWYPVVHHANTWVYPGDIWGAYRSAHYIAWGSLGGVYGAGTALVSFPGILFLFAPLTILTSHLGLTESFPYYISHPTAWLALGPYEIIIGCSVLYACDALAQRLGVSEKRRIALCFAQGIALWPVIASWGHPEDSLAVALAIYALVLALDDRWTGAGWLFGAAVATQPLVLLVLPVLLARAGLSRARSLIVRSLAPAALLVAVPLGAQFRPTVRALVDQPNFPGIDHVTPWTFLAPRLGGHGTDLVVASGPGRIVAVVAACVLGIWARRWRSQPELIVWAAALALALRCFTESVMVAYYVWPPLAVLLVVAASRRLRLFALVAGLAIGVTVSSEIRLGQWEWWLLAIGGIAMALLGSVPARPSRLAEQVPIHLNTAGIDAVDDGSRVFVGATP